MKNKIAEITVKYSTDVSNKTKIQNSKDAYRIFKSSWNTDTIELLEEFKVLFLNTANDTLGIYHLSKGGTSSTSVDIKILFSVALKCNAYGIIIVHNHPSCNLKASQSDLNITKKIKKASNLLELKLLDHLIITKNDYYSFADDGIL